MKTFSTAADRSSTAGSINDLIQVPMLVVCSNR
jgi:hypothetical protein